MNLIVNLETIHSSSGLEKYLLKMEDNFVFERILRQVSSKTVNRIVLLVNEQIKHNLEEVIEELEEKEKIEIKVISSDYEQKIAKNLSLDNIVSAYQTFKKIKLKSFFGSSLDYNDSTIILDGNKLYKKSILNFSECESDAYVKFTDISNNIDENYALFFYNTENDKTTEIKKIEVRDYKYNFLIMNNLKTIIQSSLVFSSNQKLVYEYINQLFEKFEFEEALNEVKHHATKNLYWSMFYFELLEGCGYEKLLSEFYIQNKKKINSYPITEAQKQMYSSNFALFELIETEQVLVNQEINEYINEGNVEFDFIIGLINSSKSRTLSLAYLIKNTIKKKCLSNEQALKLFDEIEKMQASPYIKKKHAIDIIDYIMNRNNLDSVSHLLLNRIISVLVQNNELFELGIAERMSKYSKLLNITSIQPGTKANFNTKQALAKNEKPKVAVCISGIAKYNYEKNLELMHHFISKNLDADYFVQTWNYKESYPALSEYKRAPDFDWSRYYMSRIRRDLPGFLARQANMEAVLPETSKLLFTKQYSELSKKIYFDYLGNDLKVIKKYDYFEFLKKIKFERDSLSNLNNNLINYFERDRVNKLLLDYIESTQTSYDYVINIDINVVLRSSIYLEEIKSIAENEVRILNSTDNKIDSKFTICKFNTAVKLNNLWSLCQQLKTSSPYLIQNKNIIDENQDLMLIHILKNEFKINPINYNFGGPYINKKIKLPSVTEAVKRDLATYEGDKKPIIAYFDKVESIFTVEHKNNTNYQSIDSVTLQKAEIIDRGINIEISIKGKNMKSYSKNRFYIHGLSKLNFDSTSARSQSLKLRCAFLKHEDDEIVIRRIIYNRDLYLGKSWNFTLLFHDYTLTHFKIEFEPRRILCELDKNGMKYISRDSSFEVGLATKSYLLNEF